MIVHCSIFCNPEPTIKWFKDKIPLNLCSIPRYKIFNHPDELHEHTIASLIVTSPSYLDNGDFIVEVANEVGCERRTLHVMFQTEEEYNAIYYKKYLEHKENLKYHHYQPGETRWEDIVPEVKEFVFWEPPEEEDANKKDEVEEEAEEEEEEEEEDCGWNVPGEVAESEEEDEPTAEESKPSETVEVAAAPAEEPVKEPSPEKPVEREIPAESEKEVEAEVAPEETPAPSDEASGGQDAEDVPQEIEPSQEYEDGAFGVDPVVEEEYEPYVRKEPEVEHPIILRRPKFYITDFQLRKKFYLVIKLIDVELLKGKTLRMQSVSSSIGPVTCEWRHNGRLLKAPTARKTIEFYPRKNQTILEIENTRVQDSGTYTVTIYNDYTEPLIDSCKVNIIVPQPKETADQPPTFTRLLTGINHFRLIKLSKYHD